MARGRPNSITEDTFVQTILPFSEKIYNPSLSVVVSKNDIIWEDIARCFLGKLKATSLYSLVVTNRFNILNKIKEVLNTSTSPNTSTVNAQNTSDTSFEANPGRDISNNSAIYNERQINFEILIPRAKFDDITNVVYYKRSTREAKERKRQYLKFRTGVWQSFFNKHIWENTRLKCGINYKSHNLSLHGTTGKFSGKLIYSLLSFTIKEKKKHVRFIRGWNNL